MNETLALGEKGEKKLVLRFNNNLFSNKELEMGISQLLGEAGIGPEILEANEKLRVQKYVTSRCLSTLELQAPKIFKAAIEKICDANYHKPLLAYLRSRSEPSNFQKNFGKEGKID